MSKRQVSARSLASIIGDCVWAVSSVPFAQAHYRSLQQQVLANLSSSEGDFNQNIELNERARSELRWWVDRIEAVNGKSIAEADPDLVIFSDASLQGWGAYSDGVRTNGPWPSMFQGEHINFLELTAAVYAVKSFTAASSNVRVQLFLDNATAVAYINKAGGTRSHKLCRLAQELIFYCENRSITVTASHIAGARNLIADELSRCLLDSSDWRLNREVFRKISNLWELNFDLFAKEWNTQLGQYASWSPQPTATAVNAFSVNWATIKGYLFPPFSLIGRCLSKVKRELATVVLVAPIWPQQPWYPLLLELACDLPRRLPQSESLLTSAKGEPHPLLMTGSLQLAAWKLSGRSSLIEDFRNSLPPCCSQEADRQRLKHTKLPGDLGLLGVNLGEETPFLTI